jgi:hypothetical protein
LYDASTRLIENLLNVAFKIFNLKNSCYDVAGRRVCEVRTSPRCCCGQHDGNDAKRYDVFTHCRLVAQNHSLELRKFVSNKVGNKPPLRWRPECTTFGFGFVDHEEYAVQHDIEWRDDTAYVARYFDQAGRREVLVVHFNLNGMLIELDVETNHLNWVPQVVVINSRLHWFRHCGRKLVQGIFVALPFRVLEQAKRHTLTSPRCDLNTQFGVVAPQ